MASILVFQRALLSFATAMAIGACATTGATKATGNLLVPVARSADRPNATLVRADSAWEAGSYVLASELYEAIVARDSSSHLALFRLATLRSWDARYDEAIELFQRYNALEPKYMGGRVALARVVAWSGRYSESIAMYDSVIAREPTNRDAVLGRAQTLAWAGRLSEALTTYKLWTASHQSDRNAAIEYARILAWNGQLDDAESMYAQLARTGNANARKGLARVISWRGDLDRSERTWRQVLETDPTDPEALTGLAQVLTWQGRQADAESALELALRANPSYGDARALMRWVRADLRPSVTITGLSINDSDNNRSTYLSVDYAAGAWWNGAIGARYAERSANFAAINSRADAVDLLARWQPGSSTWQVRADGGVTRHSSTFVPSTVRQKTIGNGALRISGNLGRALTVGVSGSRAPFDETALLIANGVVASDVAGDTQIALPARLTLSGTASRARITGGTNENTRNAFSSTLRWTYSRSWSLAIGGRQFGYDTTSTDGYFAPRRYTLAEASGRGHLGENLGWNADADMGVGRQSIEFFGSNAGSHLAERIALSLGYRFDPAHEVSAAGGYANVAAVGQTTGSEYKWYTFTLRARVGF
ncbi:MAG: tetratricopeptide repeat protein [Gemmatimonadaceae bacterium]